MIEPSAEEPQKTAAAAPVPPIRPCRLGPRIRRFRRLRGIKQAHFAETLGVSQGLVSRWESELHVPPPAMCRRIEALLCTRPDAASDRALRRLVETAGVPVHLICDTTHTLLAASPAREIEWRATAGSFIGQSLWRFATSQIVAAEDQLADGGWFGLGRTDPVLVPTQGNGSTEMRILPSTLEWEQVVLADGRAGRLVTTVAFA